MTSKAFASSARSIGIEKTICDAGVTGYSFDDAVQHYREAVLYYLVGAMSLIGTFDAGNERGAAMTDAYCTRIATLWRQEGTWFALYDGSASVDENYEERCGLAYSADLRSFQRLTPYEPLFAGWPKEGALRYFDLLRLPTADYFYYEASRADASHDLRVYRRERAQPATTTTGFH